MKKIIITGLLKEKSFGNTQNGNAYARITLSEIGFKKDGTSYESKTIVTVWSQTLVNALVNIYENSMLLVEGDVSVRMFDKQDGTKGATLDVTANSITVLNEPQYQVQDIPQPNIVSNVPYQQPVMQQPIQQPVEVVVPQQQPTQKGNQVEIPVGYTNFNNNNFNNPF